MLCSILDVKLSICFPAQSTGSIQQVIIALVFSVNVCQMDIAADVAACDVLGNSTPQEKGKRKRRKHFDFLLEFYFTS